MNKFSSRMWLAALLGALAFIGGSGLTITSAWLITMAAQQPPILTLTVAIVMVRFFGIFRSVVRYGERIVSHSAVFRRLSALRTDLFEKLSKSGVELARDLNSGKTVKAIVDDVERAEEFALRITLPNRSAQIAIAVGVAVGYWIRVETLYFTLPAAVLTLWVIPIYIKGICRKSATRIEELESEYSQSIHASSEGIIEASIYGYLADSLTQTNQLEQELLALERKLAKSSAIANLLTLLTIGSSITFAMFLARNLQGSGEIPLVGIAMLIFLPLVFFESITAFYPNLFAAGKLIVAQNRVDSLMNLEVNNTRAQVSLLERVKEFSLRDVEVSWRTRFMKPVSFTASPGAAVVIRGPSGVGKSTLAMGILGALPYRGSITVNGCEISSISNLSQVVTGTVQQSHIFNTTIRENLKIADQSASDADLLRILDLVEFPQISLDTVVGEFGRPLSGGEAKRIGLARALLSPAPILILDEPTEHLEEGLALRIEEQVLKHYADRILIIITHSGWGKAARTVTLERE